MDLSVVHETRYAYVPVVETAQHVVHLKPLNTPCQELLSHSLTISPEPAQRSETIDVFGNTRNFFSLQTAHDELCVTASSVVRTRSGGTPASRLTWDQVRERFRYHAQARYDSAVEFVFASDHAPRHDDFAAYARPSFIAGTPLLLAARDLMERIHDEFTYSPEATEVNTPALQALEQRSGVCQDFAHIMVACVRAMGVPARYVSGYLLTEPAPGQPRLIGSDASHAWASIYVPDLPEGRRWCDFDPTNNRWGWCTPGEDYVTLALGRDYVDVSPVRGVIHGGAHHTLHVGVTVQPLHPTLTESES